MNAVTEQRKVLLEIADLKVHFDIKDGKQWFWQPSKTLKAVDGVTLRLYEGETLGVVGESGCGKSTFARAIIGLVKATDGKVAWLGKDLLGMKAEEWRDVRSDIQMIFQDPLASLNPRMTIGEIIAEPLRTYHPKMPRQEVRDRVKAMMMKVGLLPNLINRYPHEFSGGQCQRIGIARALILEPKLIICDEPVSALDVSIQAQVVNLLQQLPREMGLSLIFIAHDLAVVKHISDRVLVMYRGEAVETGSVEEIFRAPKHPYTQALLAAVPRLGAMRGTSLPRRFPLLNQSPSSEGQNTVVAGEPILKVRDLVARFPLRSGILNRVTREVHAVEKVSFDLWPGETLSLVGESGCGKSTTGRALLRLVETQGGSIIFNGQRIDMLTGSKLQALRRDIQFIFQDPYASLDPRQTVGYSIMEPLRVHRLLEGDAARERVSWLLERVGLEPEHAWRYPHEFSGGQRQRICIARALALNPKVVIADESVSALDVSIRAQIINLMLDLQREMGIAFLFISHDMAVVERISHRVAVMYRGRIVEIGPRRAVFENPQHPYTRKLMAAVPVADPAHRRPQSVLLSDELPGNIFKRGEEGISTPLQQVGPGHFVARESAADVLAR